MPSKMLGKRSGTGKRLEVCPLWRTGRGGQWEEKDYVKGSHKVALSPRREGQPPRMLPQRRVWLLHYKPYFQGNYKS